MTSRQIESARRVIVRQVRRHGKYWIRIFPDKPVTKKPAETRMGKGKGGVEYYVAVVKPGRVLFEISGLDEKLSHEVLKQAAHIRDCHFPETHESNSTCSALSLISKVLQALNELGDHIIETLLSTRI